MAAAVFSHWLLDLPVHSPDLPLIGNAYKVGLELWHYPLAAWLLESALLVGGLWAYLRSNPVANKGLAIFTAVLLLINAANLLLPQMPMPESVYAAGALVSYALFALVAHRLDSGNGRLPM